MTWDDMREIQRELNVTLPKCYVETMCSYPFPPDTWLEEVLLDDAKWVVETNREWRNTGWANEIWKDHHFVIGHDGGECCYYIDTRQDDSPVFTISLEDSDFELIEKAPSLRDFVDQNLRDYEAGLAEKRERELRKASKRWWQFWK